MDTKQIEYIIKIAEENNITRAAEKLFITQSALNQQLLKLEQELGTQLFRRSRTDWGLTEAGKIYLDGAKAILNIKKETYNRIYDVSKAKKGKLTIGLTPGRGLKMFTDIYPQLHQRFPYLEIFPIEMRVYLQQQAIARGDIDIGFITLAEKERSNDMHVVVSSEEMVVTIPAGHPLAAKAAPPGEPLATLDIRELRYEPFVMMDNNSTLRAVSDRIFRDAGVIPNMLFETNNTRSIVSMVESTLCCGIIPYFYVQEPSPKIVRFALPDHPSWDMAIIYRKNSYLSSGAKEFIRLAQDYWGARKHDILY